MGTVLAFVVVGVIVVTLAGPMPTIVNGILLLILAGVLLVNPQVITQPLGAATAALSGKSTAKS